MHSENMILQKVPLTWKFTHLTTKIPTANSLIPNLKSLSQTGQNITFYSVWWGWQTSGAEDPKFKMCLWVHMDMPFLALYSISSWPPPTHCGLGLLKEPHSLWYLPSKSICNCHFHRTDTYSWVLPVLR